MNNKASIPDKKQYYIDIAVILLICLVFFAFLELRYPYFFLQDDNADAYLCMYKYSVRSVLNGEFPFYNFHEFCGKRFIGTGQTGSLNLLVYLAALVSQVIFGHFDAVIDIMAIILIIIGSLGTYILLRSLGCTRMPAIIGAVGWNLNTYNIYIGDSWIIVLMTTAALPWIYFGSLKLHQKHSVFNLLLAVIPRIALFYCGHPQFFVYSAIFDFIFVLTYTLLSRDKNTKSIKPAFHLIGEYLISYIIVALASLPLMLPMLDLMSISERSDKLSFEDFIETSFKTDVGFCGLISVLFTFIGIALVIAAIARRRYFDTYREELIGIIAALPVVLLTLLWMFSTSFNRIIYLIPILNRFRWAHKLTIITVSAVIIISSLAMTVLERFFKQRFKNDLTVVRLSLLVLQVISLLGIFILTPLKTNAIIRTSEVPFKEEFTESLSVGRYVPVQFNVVDIDPESGLVMMDTTSTLAFDLASYYGFNNVSGYCGFLMKNDIYAYSDFYSHMRYVPGDLTEPYPGFIEDMRSQSVRWYVTEIYYEDYFTDYFAQYGITKAAADDKRIIFEDVYAKPLAYDESNREIPLEQKINSLELTTPSDFGGGKITMNYSFDEYFYAYIDGSPADIKPVGNGWKMEVECPPGTHHINVKYVEKSFYTGITISTIGLALCAILITIYIVKKKRA